MSGFNITHGQINKVGIWVGDVIEFRGTRYKITKAKQVNWSVMDETGTEFNLRMDAAVTKAEDQSWAGPKEKTEYEKYLETVEAGITLGTVVKLTPVNLASEYPGYYIVINMPSNGTLKLAKLGGNRGKYLRNIQPSEVEVVQPKDMTL